MITSVGSGPAEPHRCINGAARPPLSHVQVLSEKAPEARGVEPGVAVTLWFHAPEPAWGRAGSHRASSQNGVPLQILWDHFKPHMDPYHPLPRVILTRLPSGSSRCLALLFISALVCH